MKAKAEIQSILLAHSTDVDADSSKQSLASGLSALPLEVWESQTPVLDSIIRETLRVAQPYAAMRRNLGREVYVGDKLIPTGAYVLYPFSDVHLDPQLCTLVLILLAHVVTDVRVDPDPWKFDPGRNFETKTAYGYVGWGAGACPLSSADIERF
jgi:cytochrome P450